MYSPQQCASLVSSFPGWANVAPVPEYDGQGRPTLFYAAIPITRSRAADLKTVGIHTDSLPIFMDPAVQAQYDGKIGVVAKSTCGGGQMVWALVPGPIFNVIAKQTVALGETLVESIILLPVPDADADTSVTYQGLHSVSYQVLHEAHFRYLGDAAPPPDSGSSDTEVQQGALLGEIVSAAKGFAKGVVGVGADVWTESRAASRRASAGSTGSSRDWSSSPCSSTFATSIPASARRRMTSTRTKARPCSERGARTR